MNQVGGDNGAQPPPQGILPTDYSRPHTLAERVSRSPSRTTGSRARRSGSILRERRACSPPSATPAARRTPRAGGSRQTSRACSRARTATGSFPEGFNSAASARLQGAEPAAHQGLRPGRAGPDRLSRRPQRAELQEHLQVFAVTNDVEQRRADDELAADSDDLADRARQSGDAVATDGAIDLAFGGPPIRGPSCGSLGEQQAELRRRRTACTSIRAEQRFGNGDDVLRSPSSAGRRRAVRRRSAGSHNFTGDAAAGCRLGIEVNF